jgi:hypothetical protein
VRAAWHLAPHQKITPGFAEKLCFTATATGSYEEAAQVASKWTQSRDDWTLHALVQRTGGRAEEQAQSRYEKLPEERLPQRGPSELGVRMVDGCQMRYRGPGWGKKKTKQDRVEWHELKLGVFYRHEESAHTETGRGILTDKIVVNWQGQSMELGRRLHWEALREGLGRARKVLYLGDGAEWVWNLKKDHWNGAVELLDFYHGSEHLWNVGRALPGEKEPALSQWVKPLRHQLRHGQEKRALRHPPVSLCVLCTAIVDILRRRRRFLRKEIDRGIRRIHGRRTGRKSVFRVFRIFRGCSLLPLVAAGPRYVFCG